jgi:hypothetical protein
MHVYDEKKSAPAGGMVIVCRHSRKETLMLKNLLAALALASFAAVLPACSSAAELGEVCETEGAAEECVDGAICGKPTDKAPEPQCLVVCTSDADCSGGTSCNGVSGTSIKACRVK